ARAGADVDDARIALFAETLEGQFDGGLGVGPRHEDARIDEKLERMKFFFADEIGDRLTGEPPLDQLAIRGELLRMQRLIEVHVERDAIFFQGVREQHLGVEPRRGEAALGEAPLRPVEDLEDGPGLVGHETSYHTACASSWRYPRSDARRK